jgi:hypothetical protein
MKDPLTRTCLSVRNFENAINNSYTHVQPHSIFFFFQCRTGVVADCFKFCGTRHAFHDTQNCVDFICLSDSHFCLHGLNTNVDFSDFILVKNDGAVTSTNGTYTVNGHKYSPPSILRYIFHIKPHFSTNLL